MVGYNWQPIKGLDSELSQVDFQEINSLHHQWLNFREQREMLNPDAYKAFLERLERRWAIETGIIEGIYDISRGVTRTLVENGLNVDFIEREETDSDPQDLIKVLEDHQETAKFITEHIRRQRPLSKLYIQELHQILTRNQTSFSALDPNSGRFFAATLNHGEFKKWPNNPTNKKDGLVHQYCPPEQVDSEIDSLVQLYNKFQSTRTEIHPILVAAWLHHRFTQIHPFQDGNGRVARALLMWHLIKEGYLPVVVSRDDRVPYINSLEAADAGDLSQFVLLLVQLERRMILAALDEPEPVEAVGLVDQAMGLVDQVVDHIVEQIKRQNQERQAQMRSVNEVAHTLRNIAMSNLASQADQVCQPLNQAGLTVGRMIDQGGPGDKEHWYRNDVAQTAQEGQHWANMNESRYFVKLSLNPEDQSRAPRLVFVISLHHVGRQLTGIMAATAFAQIRDSREPDSGESQESRGPFFKNCTVDPFTFTWQDDANAIAPRFANWVAERLSIALRYWSEFIS